MPKQTTTASPNSQVQIPSSSDYARAPGTGITAGMEYQRRLVAAAELVLSSDRRAGEEPAIDPADFGVSAEMKPHQVEGASWLVRRYLLGVNVILGDEMGLGKTLQVISFLNYVKMKLMSPGPFLILCPLSVSDGWQLEFAQFCPTFRVLKYVGDKDVRHDLRRKLYEYMQSHPSPAHEQFNFDALLTTYDIALLDQEFLSQIPWNLCVIDEAQRLKNPSSVLYSVLENQYIMPRRLLMTGTPIQNNLTELWSLLHFCMPTVFGTLEQFLSAFPAAVISNHRKASDVRREFNIIKYVLRAFMLRRTKHTLVSSGALVLPPLIEMTIMVPLTPLQKKVYISILRRELPKLLAFSKGGSTNQSLQNIVIQLRKACSHPYLFSGIEPEPFEEGEHLVQASGKLVILDLLLSRLQMSGHRVLLFAQMTHTLDILQDFLELRKYSYERLDGSVRAEERFAAIRSFSGKSKGGYVSSLENANAFIFMISTRAGGVGLNLVAADTVIFYEQDWNPQVDKQALQRAHRIGQIYNVLAINLVSERTIEEVIMQRAKKKLQLSNEVVGGEGEVLSSEIGDMRTLIFGLQVFDPQTMSDNKNELDITELGNMSDKVLEMRHRKSSSKDDQKFEINVNNFFDERDLSVKQSPAAISLDGEIDEVAYQSWVEKFKETSESSEIPILEDLGRQKNTAFDDQVKKQERERKLREKRVAKWEALGYRSLAIELPAGSSDVGLDSGCVEFVYGDCTKPLKTSPTEPTIIFSCIDNSGSWGHGGMFTALANLSDDIPSAYHRASEFRDLHLGDLHLIKINGSVDADNRTLDAPQWVALAVVQSYNARRKVPRSEISIHDLETCLFKASFVAAERCATIHMPRLGYQDGSQRSEWYTVERLLRKYASKCGVKIYVYYFRRQSQEEHDRP